MTHPSMEEFLDFVSAKRPDESYIFDSHDGCACGQYAEKLGVVDWLDDDKKDFDFWDTANQLAGIEPHNFGALASRLRDSIAAEAEETRPLMQPDMKQFLDFVKRQPPMQKYDYDPADMCACGQFAASIGIRNGDWMQIDEPGLRRFWRQADDLASELPHDFGSLALRVRRHRTHMSAME